MELTEKLRKFVGPNGAIVTVTDHAGQLRRVGDAGPDTWELTENADRFRCEGKWLRRAEFEKLVDKRLGPGNAIQISLPPV